MILPIAEWIIPTRKNNYHPKLLRKGAFVVYTISLLLVNVLSGSFSTPISAGAVSGSELISLCNQERVAAGLGSLSANSMLAAAAQAKADNMFSVQYWDHFGPNGETPWQFILAAGYDYVYAGENLAKGFTTSEGVHSAWMASASHRENIMNGNYQEIGIAAVPGTLLGENVILVVQMFGATSVLPATSNNTPDTSVEDDYTPPPANDSEPAYQEPIDDSLVITYPEDGEMLNDVDFDLEGNSGVSAQDIEIFNNEELLGDAVCEEGIWDFRPDDGWKDDEYNVNAEGSVAGESDSVEFTLDTVSPIFSNESLDVTYEVGILRVEVVIDGDPTAVSLSVGSKEVDMEETESGVYEGSLLVTAGDVVGDCEIVASDIVGNYATLGIANEVRAVVNSVEETGFSIKTFSEIFNYALIFGLSILFVLDLYYLYKLKKIESQGKTLFKTALWVIILGVTLLVGTTGTIS